MMSSRFADLAAFSARRPWYWIYVLVSPPTAILLFSLSLPKDFATNPGPPSAALLSFQGLAFVYYLFGTLHETGALANRFTDGVALGMGRLLRIFAFSVFKTFLVVLPLWFASALFVLGRARSTDATGGAAILPLAGVVFALSSLLLAGLAVSVRQRSTAGFRDIVAALRAAPSRLLGASALLILLNGAAYLRQWSFRALGIEPGPGALNGLLMVVDVIPLYVSIGLTPLLIVHLAVHLASRLER